MNIIKQWREARRMERETAQAESRKKSEQEASEREGRMLKQIDAVITELWSAGFVKTGIVNVNQAKTWCTTYLIAPDKSIIELTVNECLGSTLKKI